jgi:hypothetical protein
MKDKKKTLDFIYRSDGSLWLLLTPDDGEKLQVYSPMSLNVTDL